MNEKANEIQQIANALVDSTRRMGSFGLKGTAAAKVAQETLDGFSARNYGHSSLRQFIEQNVPQLRIIGRAGMDVVYGLAEQKDTPAQGEQKEKQSYSEINKEENFWRIWTAPQSPLALVINCATGEVRAKPRDYATEKDEYKLLSVQSEVHRNIAMQFLSEESSIVAEAREQLQQIAQLPSDKWWWQWMNHLRSDEELNKRWMAFRRNCLRKELLAALASASIPAGIADKIVNAVSRPIHESLPPKMLRTHSSLGRHMTTATLRPLVQTVVSRMSAEQLRSLPLPLGMVLDALAEV